MAGPSHAVECPHCKGTLFREDRVVELDASVMITKGMRIPAQTHSVGYWYTCVNCQHVLDETFVHGHLSAN